MDSQSFLNTPLCDSSREAISKAEELREAKSADQIFTEALLIALSTDPDGSTRAMLQALWRGYDAFLDWQATHGGVWKYPVAAIRSLKGLDANLSTLRYSANLQAVLELAAGVSQAKGADEIRPRHLLAGILDRQKCKAHEWLDTMGINIEYARSILARVSEEDAITAETFAFNYAPGSAFSDTAAEQDALGFETSALALAEIIAKKETKAPIVIGVYGEWGSGKSTLMSLVKKHLVHWENKRRQKLDGPEGTQMPEKRRSRLRAGLERLRSYAACFRGTDQGAAADDKATQETVICVEYNAWAYTDSEKLWTGLVEQVSKCLDQKVDPCTRLRYWLDRNSRRLLGAIIVALIPAVLAVASIWVQELWSWAQDAASFLRTAVVALGVWGSWRGWQLVPKQASLAEALRVLIEHMDQSEIEGVVHDIRKEMKDAIRVYFGVSEESDQQGTDEAQADEIRRPDLKVVVFIDELDRCPLEKIVDILEAIKLFLAEEIFIVLMAVDTRIVAEAIKLHYKDVKNPDLAREYLEKIIQVPIPVPRADPDRFERFIGGLMDIEKEQGAPRPSSALSDGHIREMMVPRPSGRRHQSFPRSADTEVPLTLPDTEIESEAIANITAAYLDCNPRRAKRLLNTYRYVKILTTRLGTDTGDPQWQVRTVNWLGFTMRWPRFMEFAIREARSPSSETTGGASSTFLEDVLERTSTSPSTRQLPQAQRPPAEALRRYLPLSRDEVARYAELSDNFLVENPSVLDQSEDASRREKEPALQA